MGRRKISGVKALPAAPLAEPLANSANHIRMGAQFESKAAIPAFTAREHFCLAIEPGEPFAVIGFHADAEGFAPFGEARFDG